MKEKDSKRKIMLALILVAIISVSVIGTYAYFLTSAGRNEEQKLTIKTGTLSLTFEDNDEGLTDQIMIGESKSKEFRIRNTGTEQVTTNMLWSGLVNTYLEESLSYILEYKTAEDGAWQTVSTVSHANIPQSETTSDYNLATGLTIPSGATYYYKLIITFNNLPNVNQESDKTAILSTKFKLGDEIPESPSLNTIKKLNLSVKEGSPTFADSAITDETADGLYALEDDYGTSYYYRGAVENNYVKFGGFYWRIIRINGDGSIRMQYDGTKAWPNRNGQKEFTASGTDRFTHISQAFNTYYADAKYVGWMFGPGGTAASKSKEDAQANKENSSVKAVLDTWYSGKLIKNLANGNKDLSVYLGDVIFCNDRSIGGSDSIYINLGYGSNPTNYAANTRLASAAPGFIDIAPTFKCPQKNDAFTVDDIEKGNGALTRKIGLITYDEVVAAGMGNTTNQYCYLQKHSSYSYWTISPCYIYRNGEASVFYVNSSEQITTTYVNAGLAVAPVINIAPEYAATLTGSGTMDSPYQIPGVE